jgi:NAD(P)-dependent dehydrogenase (short-subunit alcohol dehydrogenase family)
MTAKWSAADLADQSGRTFVITGANSGIGLEAARALAGVGARVVLAVRDTAKGRKAAGDIGGATEVRELDLASLDSVRAFAAGWDGPLAVLINNAGVMAVPQATTADGFEMQIGTNHLGHFALTNLLLPTITDRVVTVSSGLHRSGVIDFDDLNWRRRRYDAWGAYGQSKLANLLFTLELARRLQAAGSSVRANAAHPGYASTNLQGHSSGRLTNLGTAIGNKLLAQSAAAGALPTLFAATEDLPSDSYVGPDRMREQRGHPSLVGRSASASNVVDAKRLWQLSEELTATSFPDDLPGAPRSSDR